MMLQWMRLQQEFRLRSSNPEPLMSALGQKQTLRRIRAMSALPPKADIAPCEISGHPPKLPAQKTSKF